MRHLKVCLSEISGFRLHWQQYMVFHLRTCKIISGLIDFPATLVDYIFKHTFMLWTLTFRFKSVNHTHAVKLFLVFLASKIYVLGGCIDRAVGSSIQCMELLPHHKSNYSRSLGQTATISISLQLGCRCSHIFLYACYRFVPMQQDTSMNLELTLAWLYTYSSQAKYAVFLSGP